MGRTKVQIRSIEDPARRKTTFMKRNAGVMKKAMELSVLCHCEVALVIFDEHGNLHQFASKDLHPTFNRVLSHRGKKDVKNNESLLRSYGVIKEQMSMENESLGNQIHLTPASQTGLALRAESFGGIVAGAPAQQHQQRGPSTPPVSAPSSPDHSANSTAGFFDEVDGLELDQWKYDLESSSSLASTFEEAKAETVEKKIPPKIQRSVDALMRDISVMHHANELILSREASSVQSAF